MLRQCVFPLCVVFLLFSTVHAGKPSVTYDYISDWTEYDPHWLSRFGLWGIGTGPDLEPKCAWAINVTMQVTPQYVQMAMAMSTTLMTLLPTLLTIGNLYVASSSEVF